MARRLTSREWTMLGLVAALGLVALWIRDPEFRLGGGPAKKTAEMGDLGDAPVIHLVKLEPTAETYDARARNLFEYYTPPPPPRPAPTRTKAPPKPRPQPPKPTPTTTQNAGPRTPPRPQPPRISFDYLGYLGPKDDRLAVFGDGEEIFLARAGEVVRDQFRVVEFQYEKLIMGFTDERFREETTELKQKPGKKRR